MKLETFQGVTIAYMRRIGAYGPENRQLMENLKAFLAQHGLFHEKSTILGIPLDDPTITPAEQLRYDVGLIVPAHTAIPLPTAALTTEHTLSLKFGIHGKAYHPFGKILGSSPCP